jgi:hypothetical protein
MMRRTIPTILSIAIILLLISASGCINIIPETQDLEPVTDEYYAEMDTVLYPYIQRIDE